MVPLFLLHLSLLEGSVDWPGDDLPPGKQSKKTLFREGGGNSELGINLQGDLHLLRSSKRLPVVGSGENSTMAQSTSGQGNEQEDKPGPKPVLVPCTD